MGYPCMLSLLHSHPFLESFSGGDAPVLWEGALMGREEMVRKEAGEGSAYGGKGGEGRGIQTCKCGLVLSSTKCSIKGFFIRSNVCFKSASAALKSTSSLPLTVNFHTIFFNYI